MRIYERDRLYCNRMRKRERQMEFSTPSIDVRAPSKYNSSSFYHFSIHLIKIQSSQICIPFVVLKNITVTNTINIRSRCKKHFLSRVIFSKPIFSNLFTLPLTYYQYTWNVTVTIQKERWYRH